MVTLGNINIGGKENASSRNYRSAITFELSAETKRGKNYVLDGWEVEISESNYLVARTETEYSKEELFEMGYAACEKALDLYTAEGLGAYNIIEPYYKYIDLSFKDSEYYLCIHDISNLSMDMFTEVTLVDKDGNIMPSAPVVQTSWESIFRYYRFSQTSNNMYDAYKWMYLVFEVLMQTIAPIRLKSNGKPAEREKAWIERALRMADASFQWSSHNSWDTNDCIAYFLVNQYDNIRCNLFHSKGGRILPNDHLGQQLVHKMLLELESFCLYLMHRLYPIEKGCGVITYQGFALMMKTCFRDTTAFASSTFIDLHNSIGEAALSHLFLELKNDRGASEVPKGIDEKRYIASLSPNNSYDIRSYGINMGKDILVMGNFGEDALSIEGVQNLCIVFYTRLINRGESRHYL